jgi:hypothetical protein
MGVLPSVRKGSRSALIWQRVPRPSHHGLSLHAVGGRRGGQRATAIWLRSSASSMREELCARRRVPSSARSSPDALVPKASTCQEFGAAIRSAVAGHHGELRLRGYTLDYLSCRRET